MKSRREISDRKLLFLSVAFYLVLWLAELASKALAVLEQFSGGKVTSSLTGKLGEGARLLGFSVFIYIVTLLLIYGLFAFMNGHYAIWVSRRIKEKSRKPSPHAAGAAFLAVNGIFLLGVYGLNASLYPASDLAFGLRFLLAGGGAGIVMIVSAFLLALYLIGFVVLTLKFARKPLKIVFLLVWAVLLVAPLDPAYQARRLFPGKGRAANRGPNVIFIGLDSLNPKHTGYAGYPLPTTPHLDAFLRESIVFENAYTPIARTFPAWYSILTGQYPLTSGVRFNLIKRKYIKSADFCLGNILAKKGYYTAHFTDEVRFSNITGAEGFNELRHPPMGVRDFVFGSFHDFSLTNVFFNNPLGYRIFPFLDVNRAVAHLYDGRYFINDLVSSLDRLRKKERFFLAAHLCVAHWPYVHASPHNFERRPGADPNMLLYDSSLLTVDEQLGRIIEALKAKGLYDNSIIVMLSDHGESAEGHGSDLRDSEQNHVLLAWKPIGPANHREEPRLARTIDIAPTVLDLLGEDEKKLPYDGMSLKSWLFGPAGTGIQAPESVIMETEFSLDTPGGIGIAVQSMIEQGAQFYEFDKSGLITMRDDFHDVLIRRRNRAILTPDWKLVYDVIVRESTERTKASLFSVRNDPLCQKDVSAEQPDVFRDLLSKLREYYGNEIARD